MIKKQDAFYKEQLARLEERSSEFYKVTTEQYQKAVEDVEAKFKRYEFILSVLICRPKFSSVTDRTPSRPSAALLWPTSTCTVSIRPNRACLRREDKVNFRTSKTPQR